MIDYIDYPFSVEPGPDGKNLLLDAHNDIIAYFDPATEPDMERLVAAAPELMEAVYELLCYAREVCDNAGGPEETRGRAPRILAEIQEYEALLRRIEEGE